MGKTNTKTWLERLKTLEMPLYASLWWLLYFAPCAVFKMGFTDAPHCAVEAAAALPLLVLAMRDGPTRNALRPEDGTKPRYVVIAMVLIPVFLLRYAADQAYCLTDAVYHGGNVAAVMSPNAYPWYVLRTCVTAPLMEELGCRWIAFGKTRREHGFWPSALASAALFGAIHVGVDPDLALTAVPGTLLYCLAYELTPSTLERS